MHNLSAPFNFQEECRMKIKHVLFPSVFSKLRIRVLEGHFQCDHMIRFSEPAKIGSLKTDRVNGPLGISLKFYLTPISGRNLSLISINFIFMAYAFA